MSVVGENWSSSERCTAKNRENYNPYLRRRIKNDSELC
nr:MAG TPA: hypothetical protein [Bacteriophage sp.]